MGTDYLTTLITVINVALITAIIFAIYKGIKSKRNFLKRNKSMDLKIDNILSKLEDR